MNYNYIANGDCLELMKELPDSCVDMCITSPPYFNLRDYGVNSQIGAERDPDTYISKLIAVFNEVHRILKDDGSCWVNIDDVYSDQSLLCIPDRFKIKMTENGWICRNEIIWHKPNAMPSSAKTRFNNDFEKMFFFTKKKKYFFQTQYEPLKSAPPTNRGDRKKTPGKYVSTEQEASVRQGMTKKRGEKIILVRKNLPDQDLFVDFMRKRTSVDQIAENSELKRSKVEHWFRRDKSGFAYPSVEDWNQIKWLVDDWSEEFKIIDQGITDVTVETDDILKNIHKGRIKRAVWSISTKPYKGYHYAAFPEELVKTPILACTSEGDVVLDPFSGSGTTAVVSKKLGRKFLGMDLNPSYVDLANERLKAVHERQEIHK